MRAVDSSTLNISHGASIAKPARRARRETISSHAPSAPQASQATAPITCGKAQRLPAISGRRSIDIQAGLGSSQRPR